MLGEDWNSEEEIDSEVDTLMSALVCSCLLLSALVCSCLLLSALVRSSLSFHPPMIIALLPRIVLFLVFLYLRFSLILVSLSFILHSLLIFMCLSHLSLHSHLLVRYVDPGRA
jgi:hypothetical protein